MLLRFCIVQVLGDVPDDGEIRFVEAAKTLEAAKRRIETLTASLPREYVIYDQQTGARVSRAQAVGNVQILPRRLGKL